MYISNYVYIMSPILKQHSPNITYTTIDRVSCSFAQLFQIVDII